MMCLNTFLLSIPGIVKSAAQPEQCCEVILEPINPANFFDLYPDVTTKGKL